MAQTTRIIQTTDDVSSLCALVRNRKTPFTVVIKDGKHRTKGQNSLQHKWYAEAAEQLRDHTAGEYKCYCKITFGVPILRGSDEGFNAMWEKRVSHLPREQQMELVEFISVTSLLSSKEKSLYLDQTQRFLIERGVHLTIPEDKK